MRTTYSSRWVSKVDSEHVHAFDDGRQRLDGVAVDDRSVLFALIACEPIFMNDPERQRMRRVKNEMRFTSLNIHPC